MQSLDPSVIAELLVYFVFVVTVKKVTWQQNPPSISRECHCTPELFVLQNKNSDFCAPLTSFDWNEVDPNLLGTSSIDTTCTVWGLEVYNSLLCVHWLLQVGFPLSGPLYSTPTVPGFVMPSPRTPMSGSDCLLLTLNKIRST